MKRKSSNDQINAIYDGPRHSWNLPYNAALLRLHRNWLIRNCEYYSYQASVPILEHTFYDEECVGPQFSFCFPSELNIPFGSFLLPYAQTVCDLGLECYGMKANLHFQGCFHKLQYSFGIRIFDDTEFYINPLKDGFERDRNFSSLEPVRSVSQSYLNSCCDADKKDEIVIAFLFPFRFFPDGQVVLFNLEPPFQYDSSPSDFVWISNDFETALCPRVCSIVLSNIKHDDDASDDLSQIGPYLCFLLDQLFASQNRDLVYYILQIWILCPVSFSGKVDIEFLFRSVLP